MCAGVSSTQLQRIEVKSNPDHALAPGTHTTAAAGADNFTFRSIELPITRVCFSAGVSLSGRPGLSIRALGPGAPTIHNQWGGAPHDTSFNNIFRKLLYYSLEIIERP